MNTDAKRYYAVLGVDPAASDEAIRLAFRRRAKDLHPDARSGNTADFIVLKRAYDALSNPEDRAAYDRACTPAPIYQPAQGSGADRWTAPYRPMPPLPKSSRRAGMGIGRYVIAFIVMAAISLGGVQAMISLTESPPSVQTRNTPRPGPAVDRAADPAPAPAESPAAPGSSKSGFWDASPAPAPRRAAP